MTTPLHRVAVYQRSLMASIERVWENVRDWEHLPWLHATSFRRIERIEEAGWGWSARIGLAGEGASEILLELVIESDRRYVSRTLEGPGAGTEIWTTLEPRGERHTDVCVEFLVPGVAVAAADRVGAGFTALYRWLWDEDEAMMRRRTEQLARAGPARPPDPPHAVDLGPLSELRGRLPLSVEFGGRDFRIVALDGALHVHSSVCPHRLGPLDACPVEAGAISCPWHGHRFDLRTGRQLAPEGRLRLAPPPRLVVADGRARLEAPPR